ncbi:hypothetical protein BU26DRAFT_540122 [Trematosphaeria pertusa]|uniref:C2H2-type domain-containing protein n=1 Tax=Trematosphaeria pertusa TaxID=390896 RepID=A0A6A6IJP2_9PLEO|nr:uncharacterized protein BU26DRAFT_540122 [Trematosphaeria pertusa]KAF2250288.1 hypothetical protein BU26DRAFT_540122 [Trematosphaeria pertusa]
MSPIRLGLHDLLEYDPRFGVLICRECQYAIQKSALQSHLLRHKIYRSERQRLLSSIAQLDLFEPHQVPLPASSSPPIDALPVISGYRCTAVGCGNLCASAKRMRRHQSEVHGLSELPSSLASFARPVKLQTFFRGTKLRYFEVTVPPSPDAGPVGTAPLAVTTLDREDSDQRDDEEGHLEQVPDADSVTPRPPRRVGKCSQAPPKSSPPDIDLETLTYFHHFTTTTSLTLPVAEHAWPATHYWQADVVLQALRRRWLMCGLLAISACHLVALANDATTARVHRERLEQFSSEFSIGWEESGKCAVAAGIEDDANIVAGQIRCLLCCAHWAFAESPLLDQGIVSEPETMPFRLQSFLTTIRGFVVPDITLHPGDRVQTDDDHGQGEAFAQAKEILRLRTSFSNARSFDTFTPHDGTSSAVFSRLSALPYRMAEAFGRPESTRDVLAALAAIAALVKCCAISFASSEVEVAWRGMATWLTKVSEHFNNMVSCHNPAALVVVAHWAASLVRRAEHCGFWFLKGAAKTTLAQIAEQLPAEDRAVHRLFLEVCEHEP